MRRSCYLLFFSLLLPVAAAATPARAGLNEFQQQAAEILEANDVPGAGIALVSKGKVVWAGGIGYADLAANRHVVSTTRFRIGSITKMFTALAVLQLVEDGRLALDQPLADIAPDVPIRNPWKDTHPVRVAHLLEHTAGFDDMHFRNMHSPAPLPDSLRETVLALDDELVVRWPPGVRHAYANPGYAVAGYVVEKVSGKPFHEYLDERVLAPMGLEHASWGVPADNDFAQGYNGEPMRAIAPRAIRLYPAGELSASPADMARVVQFFLRRGEANGKPLVTPASIERMETPHTTRAARAGLANGYGLANATMFRKGLRLHGHNGGLDGFTAALAYSPEHDFGYAVLINRSDSGALNVLENLATEFLAEDIARSEPGDFDAPSALLPEHIAGCYRMSNPRNELLHGLEWLVQVVCVRVEEDRAVFRHPVLPQVSALVAVRGALLRESGRAFPNAIFMNDGEGRDALEWSGIYFERSNRFSVTAPLVLAALALLLMASSFVFFPVWMFRWWRGALREAPALSARAWPLVASTLFVLAIAGATRLELSLLDSVNVITLGVFIGGIAFALASAWALYCVTRTWRAAIHPVAKWHSLLVALACAGMALTLVYWRLVPLRLWAW